MYDRERKIDRTVPDFVFFILHVKQWDRSFNNPKQKQPANDDRHSFHRALFKILKIIYNLAPHDTKLTLITLGGNYSVSIPKLNFFLGAL